MAGPVSAFVARKAVRHPTGRIASPIVEEQLGSVDVVDEIEAPSRPRKRRRTGQLPRDASQMFQRGQRNGLREETKTTSEDVILLESSLSDVDSAPRDQSSESDINAQLPSPVQRLSTFVPTEENVLSDTETEWTVRLQQNDTLAILGQYDIWVKSGAISISGALIHASSRLYRVYAPSTHSIPPIRPTFNPYGTGNPPCEVSIISCGSRVRNLKKIAPKFGRIWNHGQNSDGKRRSFVNLQSSADDPYKRPLRLLEPPGDWQTTIAKLVSANNTDGGVSVMVCGPKGAGKSTFCRMLANALLPKVSKTHQDGVQPQGYDPVGFLDLDPGQPEFSPPGELSLLKLKMCNLGPPFTHPTACGDNETIKAHHFGCLSPKDNTHYYYQCALDLYSHYRRTATSPLIINCSGWVQGSGLEVLTDLVHGLCLTGIIYLSTTGPQEVLGALEGAASRSNVPLHQLTSQLSEFPTRTAADQRMMSTLSYFHMHGVEGGNIRWNASPLTNMAPLVVPYEGPKQAILAIMVLGDEQNPEFYDSLLEGCVVGIAVIQQDPVVFGRSSKGSDDKMTAMEGQILPKQGHLFQAFEQDGLQTPESGPILRTASGIPYLRAQGHSVHPLLPASSYSLGQAIVRGVDTTTKTFHLLTPIPSETFQSLHQHNCNILLVRGRLDTPIWAYTEQLALGKGRRLRREGETGEKEVYGPDDVDKWAEKQPWASVVEGGRSGSGKARRIRRDLRYRSQGRGDVGSV